jgi:Holliday junction resolvase
MVGAKAKGSAAERQLLDTLFGHGFAVVRAAGSGSTSHDACDLVAGRQGRAYAIEVKACINGKQYISAEQMRELTTFAKAFGATALVAVKWTRKGWSILPASEIRQTGKLYGVTQAEMQPLAEWLQFAVANSSQ